MNSTDPITKAAAAIAEAAPEILATIPADELRRQVEAFIAGLTNVAQQRRAEAI